MVRRRFLSLGAFLTLGAVLSGCGGDPPEKEMQQAQGAIDAARAARADQYASDEFDAAVKALERARQAAADRDYRQALNDALDSRERAQTAVAQAADAMAAARVTADRAVAAATTSLGLAQTHLKALEAARAPARALAAPRKSIAAAEQRVQEARAAFDRRDYPLATATATEASRAITEIMHALDAVKPAAPRRSR